VSGVADSLGMRGLGARDQLVLAALLRLLVRLDGKFSDAEQDALEEIAMDFGEKSFWQLMDEAGRTLPDEQNIRVSAAGVTDTGARRLIFDVILRVAQSDTIQVREQGLLDWLRSTWQLDG